MVEVEESWSTPLKRELLPVPNPYARTNLVFTSKGRQIIKSKLECIHLDSVKWDGLPLSEVIINLNDEARKRDPERRGINFIINNNVDTAAQAVVPGVTAIDPATGLPAAPAAPLYRSRQGPHTHPAPAGWATSRSIGSRTLFPHSVHEPS